MLSALSVSGRRSITDGVSQSPGGPLFDLLENFADMLVSDSRGGQLANERIHVMAELPLDLLNCARSLSLAAQSDHECLAQPLDRSRVSISLSEFQRFPVGLFLALGL